MSMQMSVLPNLCIYGDVKPSDINKGLIYDKIGFGRFINRKAIETSERQVVVYKDNSHLEPRVRKTIVNSELMIASG